MPNEHDLFNLGSRRAMSNLRRLVSYGTMKAGLAIVIFSVLVSIIGLFYTPYNPLAPVGPSLSPPSLQFLMGTNNIGQDIFSQWLVGARYTLIEGLLTAIFATALGVPIGMLSGFFRILDTPLMRLTDTILALPTLPLMIVIGSFIKLNIYDVAILVAILSWTFSARTVRSGLMTLKTEPFVEVAIMSGVPKTTILFKDLGKHILGIIVSYGLFSTITGIITVASLQFIGAFTFPYGWGAILAIAYQSDALLSDAWWWLIIPGISIAFVLMGFALVSYSLEVYYKK